MTDRQHAPDVAWIFDQAAWEDRYRVSEGRIWSGNPNPVLVAEAGELAPGTALDVGCGEGADALWLATRGWQVTGVDISTVALARATAQADLQGVRVEWRHANLVEQPLTGETFDLVSVHYMQMPLPERAVLYRNLAAAVAPGGTLLVGAHDPADLPASAHRHHLEMMFTAEQLVGDLDLDLDDWEVLAAEARPRPWTDPDGNEITRTDTVVSARRR